MSKLRQAEEAKGLRGNRGSSQSVLLLLLLLVVAVGAYLYYFTDLIRPREGSPNTVAVESPQVKMPMPQRQTAMSSAQATPGPAAKVLPPHPSKGTGLPPAKGAPQPKATPASPARKPEQAAVPAAPEKSAKKVQQQEKKPQHLSSQPVSAEAEQQSAKKAAHGSYTLLVGDYVVEQNLDSDKTKIKKAGLVSSVKKKAAKRVTMNRLFLSSFSERPKAEGELKKLEQMIDGPFILPEKGKYGVYAGSYYNEQIAVKEQDRLNNLGITLVLKKADVSLPVSRLTAGHFSSRQAAQQAALRLKKHGVKASVIRMKD